MQNSGNADVSSNTPNDISDIFELLENISDDSAPSKETILLNSLKPYLNQKRQKKLEQCEKIMSLTDTLKLLNDLHIFDNFLENNDE